MFYLSSIYVRVGPKYDHHRPFSTTATLFQLSPPFFNHHNMSSATTTLFQPPPRVFEHRRPFSATTTFFSTATAHFSPPPLPL
jgi:hypothetical protein